MTDLCTGTKVCSRCGEEKPVLHFACFKKSPDGLDYWCRQCHAERSIERRRQHPPHAKLTGINPWNEPR